MSATFSSGDKVIFDNSGFPVVSLGQYDLKNYCDAFYSGKSIEISGCTPYSYLNLVYQSTLTAREHFKGFEYKKNYVVVPESAPLFEAAFNQKFREFAAYATGFYIQPEAEYYPYKEYSNSKVSEYPNAAIRAYFRFPFTENYDYAIKNSNVELSFSKIRPDYAVRFYQDDYIQTEFFLFPTSLGR